MVWLHVAIEWFLGITTPALVLIGLFVVRTRSDPMYVVSIVKPVERVSVSEVETVRMKSMK
jgi:hypothetical protein